MERGAGVWFFQPFNLLTIDLIAHDSVARTYTIWVCPTRIIKFLQEHIVYDCFIPFLKHVPDSNDNSD